MKTVGVVGVTELAAETGGEAPTRDRVARAILEHGPVTATQLAGLVGLTPAAVRRHLDALESAGAVSAREVRAHGPRGRGRPAREFQVTDSGHAAMTTAYDDLATSALRFLAEQSGAEAVGSFARTRVADLEERYRPLVDAAGPDAPARAAALAAALSGDGFAATVRPLGAPSASAPSFGAPSHGLQLCQGHCPVQHVAAEFPQLCDAETEVFSRLLGVHVQRLATLAGGAHVCTTHVPLSPVSTTAPAVPASPARRASA